MVYKINDSNYFKIRELAAIINGTSSRSPWAMTAFVDGKKVEDEVCKSCAE